MPNCHTFFLLILATSFFLGSGCSQEREPYRSYYFPLEDFDEGVVYIYQPANELNLGNEIWRMHSFRTDTGMVLMTRIYDQTNTLIQSIRETQVVNGMLADETVYYTRDTSDRLVSVPLNITRNALFPFVIPDTGKVYTYQASWREPGDSSLTTTLTRYRRYDREEVVTTPDGGSTPAVIMRLNETIDNDGEGVLSLELSGEETYGKGYGLMAWKRILPTGDTLAFRLKAVMSQSNYEAKYGRLE